MKMLLISSLSAVLTLSAITVGAAAVPDPDADSTTPTGWAWWLDRTPTELENIRQTGLRIIDLEPSPSAPGTFDAVLVANTGTYARSNGWWHGYTAQQVIDKVAEKNGRLTELEPYTVNGQRNTGTAMFEDGMFGVDPLASALAIIKPIENSVEEVKMLTGTLPAEYGHSASGVISTVKKSGTNSVHGMAADYGRTRRMTHRQDPDAAGGFVGDRRVRRGVNVMDVRIEFAAGFLGCDLDVL